LLNSFNRKKEERPITDDSKYRQTTTTTTTRFVDKSDSAIPVIRKDDVNLLEN
jgi:hypothetical protein